MPAIKRSLTLAAIAATAAPAPPIAGRETRAAVNRQQGARPPRSGPRRDVRGLKARWPVGATRVSTVGLTAVLALVCCALAARPAVADTRPLHLGSPAAQFTSFTCLDASCSLAKATLAGTATSNLATGVGSFQATLIVDFSPGGSCNIVTEDDAFIFEKGTVFVHSHHEDCVTHGLRIDTTFQVSGGTGAFQGATGSGREFSAAASPAVIYNGTISF